jgi:hypothetical protein
MPETTIMRDSAVGDAWIKECYAANPVQRVLDAAGNPTPNLLSGPVRLTFCDALFEAKPQMRSDPTSKKKFGTGILFTPFTDLALFWEEYYKVCASDFAKEWNPHVGAYQVDNPISDQALKAGKYSGFTPGLMTTTLTSDYKPPIVDIRGNPVVDESKVYPGVWAIVSCNSYASGKNFPKKGPRFGLQTIMLIADDKPLSGGAPDPRSQFARVQVKPPIAVPPGSFGAPTAQPPAPGTGAFYPPGGAMAPPMQSSAPPRPGQPALPTAAPPPLGTGDDDISQFMS